MQQRGGGRGHHPPQAVHRANSRTSERQKETKKSATPEEVGLGIFPWVVLQYFVLLPSFILDCAAGFGHPFDPH